MKKAMLFAAGLGTRLQPITDDKPKALVEVNGKTLLERNVEYLNSFGITEITVNVHHFSGLMRDFLARYDSSDIMINISDESDEVLETGGGLVEAQNYFTEDFVAMNVDILTNLDLHKIIKYHNKHQPLATLAVTDRQSSRKLFFDESWKLNGWIDYRTDEKIVVPDSMPSYVRAFSGIHIISPKIFPLMPKSGKFSIMKTYMDLMPNHSILGYDHTGDKLLDVGKLEAIAEAEQKFP